uniref:Uncharacterized protein n=1 Tax=Lepeophtheirus salmonis TaxID=72036 RepID=A0A0K2UUC5_LEPSM
MFICSPKTIFNNIISCLLDFMATNSPDICIDERNTVDLLIGRNKYYFFSECSN